MRISYVLLDSTIPAAIKNQAVEKVGPCKLHPDHAPTERRFASFRLSFLRFFTRGCKEGGRVAWLCYLSVRTRCWSLLHSQGEYRARLKSLPEPLLVAHEPPHSTMRYHGSPYIASSSVLSRVNCWRPILFW